MIILKRILEPKYAFRSLFVNSKINVFVGIPSRLTKIAILNLLNIHFL